MRLSSIYCQNCRTANKTSETHCQKCGIRLMLVVFPNSLQYDTNYVPTFYEDHLLERVTTLELQLGQTVEKLESAYTFVNRCLDLYEKEHILLQAFLKTIEDVNPELSETISRKTTEIYNASRESLSAENKKQITLSEIQAQHDNPNAELFTKLVSEGINLLEKNEEKEAFQMLERAALLSTKNFSLFVFIGESYFRADKFTKAKQFLEKALKIAPTNPKLLLMVGTILADEGNLVNARRWLSVIVHQEKKSCAVNYIWGMLAAFESNWAEAVTAFKQSLGKQKIAEIEYLIGCVYLQIGREKLALRHLQKAILIDEKFSDAHFMQSIIFEKLNDPENAAVAWKNALEIKENGSQCLEFINKSNGKMLKSALPFIHFQKTKPRILTGGSLRLRNFLKKQVLKATE